MSFPCDKCSRCVRTKVVYQTLKHYHDSEEKCEYGCTLYNIPADLNAGSKCKTVRKWLKKNKNQVI